ncbi:hypothetical protein [Nonomuraea dietziae]
MTLHREEPWQALDAISLLRGLQVAGGAASRADPRRPWWAATDPSVVRC